jgi:hypothetical protein
LKPVLAGRTSQGRAFRRRSTPLCPSPQRLAALTDVEVCFLRASSFLWDTSSASWRALASSIVHAFIALCVVRQSALPLSMPGSMQWRMRGGIPGLTPPQSSWSKGEHHFRRLRLMNDGLRRHGSVTDGQDSYGLQDIRVARAFCFTTRLTTSSRKAHNS